MIFMADSKDKNKKENEKEKIKQDRARQAIEKTLIDICLKVAKNNKGCLIVLMDNSLDYAPLFPQDVIKFNIIGSERRVEALAMLDGACIVNPNGELIGYGMNILNVQTIKPRLYLGIWGTRHQASYTASLTGNKVFMASEEDKKIRIWQNGKIIMQLDALEKGIENKTSEAANLLQSLGFGSLATISSTIIAPAALAGAGIAIIPGIIIFGAAHYMAKQIFNGF